MKNYLLLVLVLVGCNAQVEETPEPPACPVVACGWDPGAPSTCLSVENTYSSRTHFEQVDELTACWIHDAVCVPRGTRAECVPDECRRSISDCQPDGEARIGRP